MRRYTLSQLFGMAAAAAIALGADAPVNWGLGHFVRPDGVNPAIAPRAESVSFCPMRKTQIQWESLHAFNPAAWVRHGKLYILYRPEDNTGEIRIRIQPTRSFLHH